MDDALTKRTANIRHTQLEKLISYMEKYPNLATLKKENFALERREALWFDLYVELNAVIGGTQKTLKQWKKTWNDQKAKTHAKAMKLIETGGDSAYLTPLEERVLKILSLNNEFKSPEPSSDIFLIPETGIVFSLPIVAQDRNQPSVSQEVSSTPSASQDAPDTFSVSQKICDPEMPESSNISVPEILPTADNPELHTESSVITMSSTGVPFLIKQETQGKSNPFEETTKPKIECFSESANYITDSAETTESVNKTPVNVTRFIRPDYSAETVVPATDYPSSATAYSTSKTFSGRGRKRHRSHLRSQSMTADKAAGTFGYISDRNCAVLERITSAMEAQANRAAKQTQLLREIVKIVKQK